MGVLVLGTRDLGVLTLSRYKILDFLNMTLVLPIGT